MPIGAKEIITRLDPGALTDLVTRLLSAELGRLGAAAGTLIMSGDLTEADGGLDGLIRHSPSVAGDGSASLLPSAGQLGIQSKATKQKAPSAFDLKKELEKPGPTRVLTEGGSYLLVSGQDLNPAQRVALENELQNRADARALELAIGTPVATYVWDAQSLSDLCDRHPGPIIEMGLEAYGPTLTLPELLASLQADRRPYRADAKRSDVITHLRERIVTSNAPLIATLQGLPGTGKTRLIAEVLDTDELRDRVLYVNGPDALRGLTTPLRRNEQSGGVVIADEVDDHETSQFTTALAALGGRWRVIAVRGQTSNRFVGEGARSIVLPPLDAATMRLLVEEHSGLDPTRASRVADVAEGFPELAFRLSEELIEDPELDLIRLAHMPGPAELLKRALPDPEERRLLGPIALFSKVGFDDEVSYQATAVADTFGVAEADLRFAFESGAKRFTSRLGRYRQVSPLLVAVWLATETIESTVNFTDLVFGLPEPLQDAFVEQLGAFGPDVPHLPQALADVLQDSRFRSSSDFDSAAGRLLRAAAAIVPAQVAEALLSLVGTSSPETVRALPRRDLVEAAVVLLWDPASWRAAVDVLFRLALDETESWANNATGEFVQAFALYLSGSTVPFETRADWLEAAIHTADPRAMGLLSSAAAKSLSAHAMRMHTGVRGGFEPTDWQPTSPAEFVAARSRGWQLLLQTLDRARPDMRIDIVKQIASSLRVAYTSGIHDEVDAALRERAWSQTESAILTSDLAHVLKYETELPADVRASVEALRRDLIGGRLEDRLGVAYETSIWDMHTADDEYRDIPTQLLDLVVEVAARPDALDLLTSTGRDLQDQQTRYVAGRQFALALGPDVLGAHALDTQDWTLLAASLSVADETDRGSWATETLQTVGSQEPDRVVSLFVSAGPEEVRTAYVLSLIESGAARAAGLANLLYGARIRLMRHGQAMAVVRAVADDGQIEAALGMLDQWLDENPPEPADLDLAFDLARTSLDGSEAVMTEHYVERLLDADIFTPDQLMELWQRRAETTSGLVDTLDIKLTEAAMQKDPMAMLERAEALVRAQADGNLLASYFSSRDLRLLSRLAHATSADAVWERMNGWDDRVLGFGLHHLDWRGTEPDDLTRTFLDSSRLPNLANEAAIAFLNSLGVVVGSMADAQDGERTRVLSWKESLVSSTALAWADDLAEHLKRRSAEDRRREEEERLR